jgi:hypothetical protein
VTANLNAPSEYAIALVPTGTEELAAIEIEATWP